MLKGELDTELNKIEENFASQFIGKLADANLCIVLWNYLLWILRLSAISQVLN